ncbi:MAG: hypothetical protein WA858_17545, partial [Xanthobacteraceae bacterium]
LWRSGLTSWDQADAGSRSERNHSNRLRQKLFPLFVRHETLTPNSKSRTSGLKSTGNAFSYIPLAMACNFSSV